MMMKTNWATAWLAPNMVLGGLVMAAIVLAWAPAHAQQGITQRGMRPQVMPSSPENKSFAPPAALPGAKPAEDSVAPADRAASDMNPNEALFDAVNRGDLGAAKDALNRGADLTARNVLGQTALDLSVDLGRNDISFLLLGMRNGGGDARVAGVQRGGPGAAKPVAGADARATREAARQAAREQALAARQARASGAQAAAAPGQGPQLFAGNGGTPVPQAGFLGFGQH